MPIAIIQLEPSNARLGSFSGLEQVNPQVAIALGSAAVGALASWLISDDWSVGEYNHWMVVADNTFPEWDKIGWSSGCWDKDKEARKKWLAFWARFSKHYKEHGQISTYSYVSDSEEKPARALLQELQAWGAWFEQNCGVKSASATTPGAGSTLTPSPNAPTDWGSIAKYSAFAVGGIVLLGLINTIRDATAK